MDNILEVITAYRRSWKDHSDTMGKDRWLNIT
jgi:hypothetical protein